LASRLFKPTWSNKASDNSAFVIVPASLMSALHFYFVLLFVL
jgi:hypothetical protein